MNSKLKALCKYKKKNKKVSTLKIIVDFSILKTVLNSSEVNTAGLIFRIYSNTVSQTVMMWDKDIDSSQ